jgi:hypothetical protein
MGASYLSLTLEVSPISLALRAAGLVERFNISFPRRRDGSDSRIPLTNFEKFVSEVRQRRPAPDVTEMDINLHKDYN